MASKRGETAISSESSGSNILLTPETVIKLSDELRHVQYPHPDRIGVPGVVLSISRYLSSDPRQYTHDQAYASFLRSMNTGLQSGLGALLHLGAGDTDEFRANVRDDLTSVQTNFPYVGLLVNVAVGALNARAKIRRNEIDSTKITLLEEAERLELPGVYDDEVAALDTQLLTVNSVGYTPSEMKHWIAFDDIFRQMLQFETRDYAQRSRHGSTFASHAYDSGTNFLNATKRVAGSIELLFAEVPGYADAKVARVLQKAS